MFGFGAVDICATIKEYAKILGVHYDKGSLFLLC